MKASECEYLRDKFLPEDEYYHVALDVSAEALAPSVVGSVWWEAAARVERSAALEELPLCKVAS